MQFRRWLPVLVLAALPACQSRISARVTILEGDHQQTIQTSERLAAAILTQAEVNLSPDDSVLFNGQPVSPHQPLQFTSSNTIQIRRAVNLTLVMPTGSRTIQTSAATVGEALSGAGINLYGADRLDPPAATSIAGPTTVKFTPSRELTVWVDNRQVKIRSAAATVGDALAGAGLPLIGLDTSQPLENEPPPADGQIRVLRISEALVLSEKSIPFKTDFQSSDQVELDHQDILQPGSPGLMISRARITYQDGQEVSRQVESQTVVRPPQDRLVGIGTKVVLHTAVVDGVTIQYWRAVQMWATAYSPCRSASVANPGTCISATSSGTTVHKGVVAVKYSWYLAMEGQGLYIPGYGYGTIQDVCGGCQGKPWVDLGYSDSDYQDWGQWVTVYFLAPIPANILNPLN